MNLHNPPALAVWAPSDRPRVDARVLNPAHSGDAARAVRRARLLPLPWPAARGRVTGLALAAVGCAATWAAVIASGPISRGAAVQVLFAATMVVCALGETLLCPAMPVITGDRARCGAAGRCKRVGTRALAAGCLLGPSAGGAALGAGWTTSLLTALAVGCAVAGIAAQRASGRRPAPAASQYWPRTTPHARTSK